MQAILTFRARLQRYSYVAHAGKKKQISKLLQLDFSLPPFQ